MRELSVSIEIQGEHVPVGTILGNDSGDSCFRYDPSYLVSPKAAPVSVSLPLREEAFPAGQTKCFFEGLLPEGFTRRSVARWMHVDEGDYLSILAGLGRECLGALRITDETEPDIPASYDRMTIDQVRELAREGATKSAQFVTKSHLSLTGASGKVGLYYDREKGDWYLPRGDAPSTHIVKQSHVRLDGIVANEQLALTTAANLGLKVPESFIINVGDSRDEDVLLATTRYDRAEPKNPSSVTISGIHPPMRLHQEDFAQALQIPHAEKYEPAWPEREGPEPSREEGERGYLWRMFDLLRRVSSDPIRDQLTLWDMIVFDFLVGNTDCHVKNFSLLYGDNLHSIRLAPAYDILSTSVYEASTRDMAFRIGSGQSLDNIRRTCFAEAALEVGLGEKMAMGRLDQLCGGFEEALKKASGQLEASGFASAERLRERILRTGGFRNL